MLVRGPIVVAAVLVSAGALRGQGACSASGAGLARAVVNAPAVRLTPEQQAVFSRLVAAVRAGNRTAQQQELASLLKLRPRAAQPADACALVLSAVRLGKVDSDARMSSVLRPGPASASDTTSPTSAYSRAVQTIAGIQRQVWEDALRILDNLKA